jgi:hypothetical protein
MRFAPGSVSPWPYSFGGAASGEILLFVASHTDALAAVTKASGRKAPLPGRKKAPLWKCPSCGHRFVLRNLRVEGTRVRRIEYVPPHDYIHHVRLERLSEVDEDLVGLLRAAYSVGRQAG